MPNLLSWFVELVCVMIIFFPIISAIIAIVAEYRFGGQSQRNSITMYDNPLLEDIARTMVLSSEKKEID